MEFVEAAHAMGITGKELAHDLNLPVDVDKRTPLRDLGISEAVLDQAVKHAAHEKEGELKWLKYPFWALICGLALLLLLRGRASKGAYLSTLAASVAATGFLLGKWASFRIRGATFWSFYSSALWPSSGTSSSADGAALSEPFRSCSMKHPWGVASNA